jgi:uncharacterized membrane protein
VSRQQTEQVPGAADHAAENVPLGTAALFERLIFLSDGVFAIAMTLLVVGLALPTLTSSDPAKLTQALLDLGPKYFSFGVSFLVVALYWTSHQRIFGYLVRADAQLVWLNVLLLLCIAFQPFPTSVIGSYDSAPAVTLYAATLSVTGFAVLALWLYASTGRRLIGPSLSSRRIQYHTWRAAGPPLVFLASIGIAQFSPTAAKVSWLAVALIVLILRRLYRDVMAGENLQVKAGDSDPAQKRSPPDGR